MLPKKIIKRDGKVEDFNPDRIARAIFKAAKAAGGDDYNRAHKLTDKVLTVLEYSLDAGQTPNVEHVQDVIEQVLIKSGCDETAKAFIIYRKQREDLRKTSNTLLEVEGTIEEYLEKTDWRVYENSNTEYSFSGLMAHTAEKLIANYCLSKIYPKEVSQAHRNADIHIHDLGYGVVGYCSGWSLQNLLTMGFGGVSRKICSKPAKHLDVAGVQMVNFLGSLQMEHAGAQAFSSVDTLLAPFIKADNLEYKRVKQNMQMLVYSLNVPSRWSCQAPFTNFTFDWTIPKDMKDKAAVVGGKPQPFTYGDCEEEAGMINKAFIEIMTAGDANGRIFFYPIPTYNITKDFDWESDNAKALFEMTSKYGIPYFQNFINSDLDPSDIRSMCCRLQLNLKELRNKMGGLFGAGDQTGSIGVVTLNMPRLAYKSNDELEFSENLEKLMNIAKTSLEIKRKLLDRNMKNGLMPFTKRYLGSWQNHFSTIGLNGMHEACVNLLGSGIESKEGRNLALRTLKFMRQKMVEFQEETGHFYNLEATPAESTSYRFAKEDVKSLPGIKVSGKKTSPYYTNSTHLPVTKTKDIFEALEHQDELQTQYTGGTVFHGFLGQRIEDPETTAKLVKRIAENYSLPYFTITPTFSVCPVHGYIPGEQKFCPYEHTEQELNRYGVNTKEVSK